MATLEQDYILPPGQTFALVSFVGPECPQKSDQLGMKIRGVFGTVDEAKAFAAKLQDMETVKFDIYVMELGKWALIPPDAAKIADVSYNQEDKLEELMTGYKRRQELARQHFKDRKDRLKKNPATYEELAKESGVSGAPRPGDPDYVDPVTLAEQPTLDDVPEILIK